MGTGIWTIPDTPPLLKLQKRSGVHAVKALLNSTEFNLSSLVLRGKWTNGPHMGGIIKGLLKGNLEDIPEGLLKESLKSILKGIPKGILKMILKEIL